METPYSLAWQAYKQSYDYKTSVETLKKQSMVQPFIDNILRLAFDAGWNSKE